MKKFYLGIIMIIVFSLVGCGGGGGGGTTTGGGTVTGSVYAPDNITPIVGASVTVRGTARSTTTNAEGKYTLTSVPAGSQTIIAIKGSYRAEISVTVTEGETVTANQISLAPIGKIGVVEGIYDDIRDVLTSLGVTYELIGDPDATFGNPSVLSEFAVIFFECGLDDSFLNNETNITNLTNFVDQGGSIYASDWANTVVEAMYPDKIDFAGQIGNAQDITANITDSEIQALLSKNTAEVCFDLPAWVAMNSVKAGVVIDLSGTVDTDEGTKNNIPLMVHFPQGNGYVAYTSFHNEAQVTEDVQKILKHLAFEL